MFALTTLLGIGVDICSSGDLYNGNFTVDRVDGLGSELAAATAR